MGFDRVIVIQNSHRSSKPYLCDYRDPRDHSIHPRPFPHPEIAVPPQPRRSRMRRCHRRQSSLRRDARRSGIHPHHRSPDGPPPPFTSRTSPFRQGVMTLGPGQQRWILSHRLARPQRTPFTAATLMTPPPSPRRMVSTASAAPSAREVSSFTVAYLGFVTALRLCLDRSF
jgi:hypothetical protein